MPQVLKRWILLARLKSTKNSLQSHSQRWESKQEWEGVLEFEERERERESFLSWSKVVGDEKWAREGERRGRAAPLTPQPALVTVGRSRSELNKNFLVRKENCWLRSYCWDEGHQIFLLRHDNCWLRVLYRKELRIDQRKYFVGCLGLIN